MTRDDVKKLIGVMSSVYPNYTPKNLSFTVDILHKVYENCEYSRIEKALAEYIATNTTGFPPVPGQLIELAYRKNLDENRMTAQEAWALVLKALSRSAYYSESEFAKLPEAVQRAVGSPSRLRSMAIDEGFNPGVEYSHFARTYDSIANAERDEQKTMMVEGRTDDTKRLAELVKNTAMALPGRLPDR